MKDPAKLQEPGKIKDPGVTIPPLQSEDSSEIGRVSKPRQLPPTKRKRK